MRLLVVTPRGREVRQRLFDAIQEVPEQLQGLSAADQRALRDILQRALG
jgi:hypothetical protein